MADKLLEVKGVSKIFRVGGMLRGKKLVAVDNVSLSIDDDKPVILSIVGESGCGKSTLCKMILRLHNPDMGDIVMDGKSYADKKSYDPKQFKLDVQPIFQNPYESFSARKTVDTYLYNTALRLGIAKNRAEADKVVDEALKSVGMSLAVVKGKYATQFSGGELQRVSIARALITRPKLIIADEPVAAIDASMKMNIVNLFKELRDKYKISFIYITHDQEEAMSISDIIIVMKDGRMQQVGRPQEVYDNPVNLFVAKFLGTPPINVFNGYVKNEKLYIGKDELFAVQGVSDREVYVGIRPEGFIPEDNGKLHCKMERIEIMGRDISIVSKNDDSLNPVVRSIITNDRVIDGTKEEVAFNLKPSKVLIFDKETEERIRYGEK